LSIQNDIGSQFTATIIIAAITTTLKEHPVTMLIEEGKEGLDRDSTVDLAQILTIDKNRLIKKLGRPEENNTQEVDEAINLGLGLKEDEVRPD
jgi:mRNA interferase MazF